MTVHHDRNTRPRLLFDALATQLGERVDGEIRFDAGSRAAYSTDASNYRQVPIEVEFVVSSSPGCPDRAR